MTSIYRRFLAPALLFALRTAAAQVPPHVEDDAGIVTDRPDITESAIVIPKRSLQFENGLAWTFNHGDKALDLSETLVRYGVGKRTEFRVALPNFLYSPTSNGHGLSDLSVGFKQQLGPLPGGFDLSIIAAVSLPTGAKALSSHGYDPFIKLPWSKELKAGWSVGGMQSLFFNTQDGRRNNVWEPTFYLEKELAKSWDVFAEYGGDYAQRGGARHVLHFGTAYKVSPLHQVDFHFGFGLNRATPNRFVAVGYSFRVDHFLRR